MTRTGEAASQAAVLGFEPETWLESIRARQRELAIGAIVVVTAVVVFWAWRSNTRQNEEKAERSLNVSANSYYSGNSQLAQRDLEGLVKRYAGTPAATQGAMLLAQIQFEAGKYDDGMKVLEGARSGAGLFAASIEALIAAGNADQKKYAEAATHYLSAGEKAAFSNDRDIYRADAARALALAGKRAEARQIWEEIATRLDSPAYGEAKIRLGELSSVKAKS